jgi:hypothetical protein
MKTLTVLLTLSSLNAFALDTYTHCAPITLQKDRSSVNVSLSKQGELQGGKLEIYTTRTSPHEKVEIDGLKSQIMGTTLIDSIIKNHWGLGGRATTSTKVYAVKFHLSADETIGHEVNGCIPQPISALDVYTICYQTRTVGERPTLLP